MRVETNQVGMPGIQHIMTSPVIRSLVMLEIYCESKGHPMVRRKNKDLRQGIARRYQ